MVIPPVATDVAVAWSVHLSVSMSVTLVYLLKLLDGIR